MCQGRVITHITLRLAISFGVLCASPAAPARAQLIPGVEEWAEASIEASRSKWVGQRVPFPPPESRPRPTGTLRSELSPVALHAVGRVDSQRMTDTLTALEQAHVLLTLTGFVTRHGDGGMAGTADHDFYLVAPGENRSIDGVGVGLDATEPVSPLDSASAYGLIDARLPQGRLATCAAQAVAEVMLFELDPAEAASIRKASGAYLAGLVTGEVGCGDGAERAQSQPELAPFPHEPSERGAAWFGWIGQREDGGTGQFMREVWHFARQHTWDGHGLRGSPDLLEAIARVTEMHFEKLEDLAAERAIDGLLALATGPIGSAEDPRHAVLEADLNFEGLPARTKPVEPPVQVLGSAYALVRTPGVKRGERLRVWSRGETGVRWALTAARIGADGGVLSRVRTPARKNPKSFLIVELDEQTTQVLIAVTSVADGTPDADVSDAATPRSVALIMDR